MTNPDIFVAAYDRIAGLTKIHSCNAICPVDAMGPKQLAAADAYSKVFSPGGGRPGDAWLVGSGLEIEGVSKLDWRLTALAFAIAMAEAGDL